MQSLIVGTLVLLPGIISKFACLNLSVFLPDIDPVIFIAFSFLLEGMFIVNSLAPLVKHSKVYRPIVLDDLNNFQIVFHNNAITFDLPFLSTEQSNAALSIK